MVRWARLWLALKSPEAGLVPIVLELLIKVISSNEVSLCPESVATSVVYENITIAVVTNRGQLKLFFYEITPDSYE